MKRDEPQRHEGHKEEFSEEREEEKSNLDS
jgi:hypothetical protein